MPTYATRATAAVLAAGLVASCRARPPADDIVAADLINEFSRIECRPAQGCEAVARPSPAVRVAVPGRLTWMLPLPHDAHLHVTAANPGKASVRFRVGISDERVYEPLAEAE